MRAEQREMEWKRLILPVAMLIVGVTAAALVAAMPQAMLDVLMWRLGLPHLLFAATPPIGAFGRTVLALLVLIPFVAAAAVALRRRGYLIGVQARPALASPDASLRAPTIRRADAHPDCPPRRPIRAEEDLGPPLPMMPAPAPRAVRRLSSEFTLPRDLEQPLAAFDPVAIPDVPRDPVRAVPPLAPTVAAAAMPTTMLREDEVAPPQAASPIDIGAQRAAWLEPGDLDAGSANHDLRRMDESGVDEPASPAEAPQPHNRAAADDGPAAAPNDTQSLESLLDRLERGARQHRGSEPTPAPATVASSTAASSTAASSTAASSTTSSRPETLTDTLTMLRQMARR